MKRWGLIGLIGLLLGVTLTAQGTLSNQVLQLLTRVNAWTATNTFLDLRLIQGVPSDTLLRFYVDSSGNLYFNGFLVAGTSGAIGPHNLLSSTHPDTVTGTPVRGDVVVSNSTPAWTKLGLCTSGYFIGSNGTDTVCGNSAAALINIPGGQITGTIAAVSGVNLTNLTAGNLTGTVPLGTLSGITNTQISGSAAIAYSKLNLAGLVNLASDMTGTLPFANGGTGLASAAVDTVLVSTGSAWTATAVPLCADGFHALAYSTATHLFTCQAISVGSGTVSSVALALPAILSVTGSPVTGAGTLTATLATETANTTWAGPTTGAAAAPTFRALVNADLPATAVTPGTYPVVTVNQQGVITAGTSTVNLATYGTGTLAYTHGGTGVTVAGDDTVLVGSGAAWVPQTLPNCPGGQLAYTQSTNLFSCNALPAGEVYYFNTTGTSVTIGAQSDGTTNMVLVPPTSTYNAVGAGTDNGGADTGRLRYTGSLTRLFHVVVTISCTPATTNDIFVFGLAKTGVVDATGKIIGKPGATADTTAFTLSDVVSLATNDYLELYVGNLTAGRNLTVKSLQISMHGF